MKRSLSHLNFTEFSPTIKLGKYLELPITNIDFLLLKRNIVFILHTLRALFYILYFLMPRKNSIKYPLSKWSRMYN